MKRGARMAKKYKGDGVMSAMNGDKIVVVALKMRDWIILCFCLGILILPSVFYWRGASMDILQHSATWRKLGDGFRAVNGHSLSHLSNEQERLSNMLQNAAMADNTVIVTTLNKAWATKNSMLDLFLESFEIGEGTKPLLKHLIIVALDQTAYDRCLSVHNHCFMLQTDGVDFSGEKFFMTDGYLTMMWRRIKFLRTILQMGYNFVFTVTRFRRFTNHQNARIGWNYVVLGPSQVHAIMVLPTLMISHPRALMVLATLLNHPHCSKPPLHGIQIDPYGSVVGLHH